MRAVAFTAVAVSTAAVVASIITLPMLYSYVQNLQSVVVAETDFCKVNNLFISLKQFIYNL